MAEYLTDYERGIVNALVIHLVDVIGGKRYRICDGEESEPTGLHRGQVVQCQACYAISQRQLFSKENPNGPDQRGRAILEASEGKVNPSA